jgi:hypothetical protein
LRKQVAFNNVQILEDRDPGQEPRRSITRESSHELAVLALVELFYR